MKGFITIYFLLFIFVVGFAQSKTAENYFELANKYFDKKEYSSAILYCDSTIELNPEHTEAYAFRGVCKYHLKNYEAAINDFNLALILVPGYAEVYFFRGYCYHETNLPSLACSDWTTAYNLGLKKAMKVIVKYCETEIPIDGKKTKR